MWRAGAPPDFFVMQENSMARFIQAFLCVGLITLSLPGGGFAGETRTAADKPAMTTEKHKPAGSKAKGGSPAIGESAKPIPQEEVQTRGFLSRKKKKTVGGAAGHTEPPDQGDLSTRGESGTSK
jgi:hypothetical protein